MSVLRHIQAIMLLPLMTTVAVPGLVLFVLPSSSCGFPLGFPLNYMFPAFGLLFIGLGLILMVKTISLFATVGKGTLAPWTPAKKLVILGPYRHVRNPMISGVFFVLIGEALLLGSIALFAWFIVFVIINLVYIPLSEERGLERRFGKEYLFYKENVPRWIPRIEAWNPQGTEDLSS